MIWLSSPISLRLAAICSGVRKAASGPDMDRSIRATSAGMSASVAMRREKADTGSDPLEGVEAAAEPEDVGQGVERAPALVQQGGVGEVLRPKRVAIPGGGPDRQAGVQLV